MNHLLHLLGPMAAVSEEGIAALLALAESPARAVAEHAMKEAVTAAGRSDSMAEAPFFTMLRDMVKPRMTVSPDGIARIPFHGLMAFAPTAMDLFLSQGTVEDIRNIAPMLREAAADDGIKGVLMDFHSPGGSILGGAETAAAVAACRKKKPVYASTSGRMQSLALLVAVEADAIIASQSSAVGSVGTVATVFDVTKALEAAGVKAETFVNTEGVFKGVGHAGAMLTQVQREQIQREVNAAHDKFKAAVKARRPKVMDESMRGQSFTGEAAREAGFVDFNGDEAAAMDLLRGAIMKRGR